MKQRAYAKINLSLDVVGVREDGYHDLKMIMVPIDFYDVVEINFHYEMILEVDKKYLPTNQKNTIMQTIRYMQERYGFQDNFYVRLQKHIPTRAGLAGGSADAAATIRMVNRLKHLNLNLAEMIDVAHHIGADVPFCVANRPSYVEGIGEQLHPFHVQCPFYILLVKPSMGVSTQKCFAIVDQTNPIHPDCLQVQYALQHDRYELLIDSIGNSMEEAAIQLVPQIATIKQELRQAGLDGVAMSGSGSTVFGLSQSEQKINAVMHMMKKKGYFVRKTMIYDYRETMGRE